jgi:hypothetical protein
MIMIDFKGYLIGFILLMLLLAILMTSIYSTINPSISYEARNFTTNNTPYNVANPKVITSTAHLYYYNNNTFEITTDRYVINATHVTLLTNGTGCYPNASANCIFYLSYNQDRTMIMNGTEYAGWIALGVIAVISIIGIGILLLFTAKKN